MKTLETFIDNLFINFEQTAKIKQAKADLLDMMEDKYNEYLAQGKTEAAAVGQVIAEFGDLEEVAESLDLDLNTDTHEDPTKQYRVVDLEEATDYIETQDQYRPGIANGVALIILGVAFWMLLMGLSDGPLPISLEITSVVGLAFLLIAIAGAVYIFIKNGSEMSKYDYLEKEPFTLSPRASTFLVEKRKELQTVQPSKIAINVLLYIIAVIPIILGSLMNQHWTFIGLATALVIVAIATRQIIIVGGASTPYAVIFQEEEYEVTKKADSRLQALSQVYWMLITGLFLGYSFITGNWGISWVIWPIAGLLFGMIQVIWNGFINKAEN